MPIEPPPTPWVFPEPAVLSALPLAGQPEQPERAGQPGQPGESGDEEGGADRMDPSDLVAIGADLEPGTLLAAYRGGLFPMPEGRRVGWWCPARRGVLELDGLRVSRSLRRATRDFEIRVDTAFDQVVARCADPTRPHGWIDGRIRKAYGALHRLGWAHSVETWRDGRLVGGLYGVAIGGLFAGESMFHHERDASKVALVGLVDLLRSDDAGREGARLVDVQWSTPHLASLGVVERTRASYLSALPGLLAVPLPQPWATPG